MLLTIIIPVFNARKKIDRLLSILTQQRLSDVEVIVVDDGSTDGSLEVCEDYGKKNSSITVLHQENKGCYMARQKALEIAKGEYVTFIDCDDIVDENYIDVIRKVIIDNNNVDMFVFGYNQQYPKDFHIFRNESKKCDTGEYFNAVLANKVQGAFALWNHVYSTAFLGKNQIQFETNYRKAGDAVFNDLCMLGNPRVYICSEIVYTWMCGHDSLTRKFEPTMWKTIKDHENYLMILCHKYCDGTSWHEKLNNMIWYYFKYLFSNINESNICIKEKNKNIKLILENNIDRSVTENCLNGFRRFAVNMAIRQKKPFWLYIWHWSYFNTWLAIAFKYYRRIKGKDRNDKED